jgi:hypothetical protein
MESILCLLGEPAFDFFSCPPRSQHSPEISDKTRKNAKKEIIFKIKVNF